MRKQVYLPSAERGETIELPVSCVLMRHAQGNVLFDTGCHPSVATDGEARWGSMARAMAPIMSADDNVISQLSCLGLSPDDIDVVICSHFHPDHCGCNIFFRKATIIVHAAELAAAKAENAIASGYLPVEWDCPMPIDVFDEQKDLFGDGHITLIPLPGHTPGLTGVLAALDRDGSFLLTSDAVALRANLEAEATPKNTWSIEHHLKSLAEIRKIEASGARIVFGHDDEQWAGMKKGVEAYL